MRLSVDGRLRAEGTGAAVLGDPVVVLEWLLAHLGGRGIGLAAGALISTGTMTGITYLEPGEAAHADYGPLGAISVRFAGPPHPRPRRPA